MCKYPVTKLNLRQTSTLKLKLTGWSKVTHVVELELVTEFSSVWMETENPFHLQAKGTEISKSQWTFDLKLSRVSQVCETNEDEQCMKILKDCREVRAAYYC